MTQPVQPTFFWPGPTPFGMTEQARKEVEEKGDFVNTQEVLGRGSSAKAYKYYNPLNGNYLVGKVFSGVDFQAVQEAYALVHGKQHLVQSLGVCPEKKIVYENLYSGPDLYKVFSKIRKPTDIVHVIFQIALGLQNLHSLSVEKNYTVFGREVKVNVPAFHLDLKPSNIFVNESESGGFQCDIGDYSNFLSIDLICTPGFESPKYAEAKLREDEIDFLAHWGQKHDLFSLGLICVALLKGTVYPGGAAPLEYLRDNYKRRQKERCTHLTRLSQGALDAQVDHASAGNKDPNLAAIWKIVKENLLRLNPNEVDDIGTIVTKIDGVRRTDFNLAKHLIEEWDLVRAIDQLTLNPVPFKWPVEPPFNWSSEEKGGIEIQIRRAMALRSGEFGHTIITHNTPGYVFQYECFYNSQEVFLSPGEVLEMGPKRTMYKCYSPLRGMWYAFNVYDPKEYRLIEWSYIALKQDNCVHSLYRDGTRVVVPLYSTHLGKLLKERQMGTLATKLGAMGQIARSVSELHTTTYTNISFKRVLKGSISHRNLNPNGIFCTGGSNPTYDLDCERVAMLLDKGDDSTLSPEESALPKDISKGDYVLFAHENGRGMDIWKLGLIFRQILRNSDEVLVARTQKDIDEEINQEISKIDPHFSLLENETYKELWNLVKQMLQVDPKKRSDIRLVLKKIKQARNHGKSCSIQ